MVGFGGDAGELAHDIGQRRHLANLRPPWVQQAGFDAGLADVIEDEGNLRTLAHHLERVRRLGMENAGVERQIVFRQQPQRFEKAGLQHELRIGLILDQAAHAARCLEFCDARDFRLDRGSALERQADNGAEHASVMGSEPVNPFGFVEILRHVDIDFDEDEPFELIGLRSIGEVVHASSRA